MNPVVSIVIPVYNMETIIGTTLLDVIGQKNVDTEIIVVDDGSTDKSPEIISSILKGYQGRGMLIAHEKNQGASASRNNGLDAANGKYVFFIDGDDRISEGTLEYLLTLAENHGADVAFTGFRVCGPDLQGGRTYAWQGRGDGFCSPREVLHCYLRGKRFVNASNALYRKSFLDSCGIRFPRGCRFAEDREFIVKALFHAERVSFTPELLVSYIQHPKQTTNRPGTGINKYAHAVGVYLRLRKYLQENGAGKSILSDIEAFEIPNAILKMVTEIAKGGDMDLYNRVVNNELLRSAIKPGLRTILSKPEIAFKTMGMLDIPNVLFRKYYKRDAANHGG